MNKYEITFITKENEKDAAVKKEIEALGGKIQNVLELGQKQLAFPVKKETAGYYTAVTFEMEPEKVVELNRKLGLKNEIIRHLIITTKAVKMEPVKTTEKVKTVKETAPVEIVEKPKETAIEEAPEKEIVPAEKPKKPAKKAVESSDKTQDKKPKKVEKPEDIAKKAEKEALSAEERLKALDEKLNELLKE